MPLLPMMPGWVVFLQDAPGFNQLPLPMRITFTVVAIGTMYAIWVFVFRDLIRQATRIEARDIKRLAHLAESHQLGVAIDQPVVLDRLNIADTDESERAYSAVQLYEQGLVLASLHHQGWQSEVVVRYANLEAVRSYSERQLTGFRAAILGPLAYLVQKKRHYLGLLIRNQDGTVQTVLLQGRRNVTEKLGAAIDSARCAAKSSPLTPETTLSVAG
ncbi:hypothetical protein [Chloracidobacterium aggregatum]|uniref:Uncharacterized protein n=1 Tax=Chloracidobacterium sp. N TaxID=2821540 RepID=A0ABX8B1E9_9BACT|nr:hypothetical protein [Chloracidobacterium aggregatum]QUV84058.1 hypothetical protein J8C03_07870 [Chloracidobacterium sp. 2]QUV87456.1 hypothetical protein J8C07_09775 [Chloracidobacterium sp. S]QUV90358.1 hypothetical protein J8C04_08775 [Chloracidobacterium sp. A]QUV93570.1 hypothetical protein J8C05_09350 [Chloracidobacterium sp. N]QUV96726.1 hypothetical protein J8C00_10495 [Chloracidobacterium sp. E]